MKLAISRGSAAIIGILAKNMSDILPVLSLGTE
jgi:hypothetical protein